MGPELDRALCEKYPLIFADRHTGVEYSCMGWGIECGDGWYTILDTLCGAIQAHINQRDRDIAYATKINGMIAAWDSNREPLEQYTRNPEAYIKAGYREVPAPITQVVASQVKEKYGGLRFYYSGGDDTIDAYVTFAEYLSQRTCDVCGAPGKQRDGGWGGSILYVVVTRCDEHV